MKIGCLGALPKKAPNFVQYSAKSLIFQLKNAKKLQFSIAAGKFLLDRQKFLMMKKRRYWLGYGKNR